MYQKKQGRKFWAALTAVFFLCQQTGLPAVEIYNLKDYKQTLTVPLSDSTGAAQPSAEQNQAVSTAIDFLQQENPLNAISDTDPVSAEKDDEAPAQNYEY